MLATFADLGYLTRLAVLFYMAAIVDLAHSQMRSRESITPPVVLSKPEEYVVGAGSNITISCSARGSQPLSIIWFQDEKTFTVSNARHNQSDSPPTTKLLEERRYRIEEELTTPDVATSRLYLMDLKLSDTSLFLCWVENAAGHTIGNFSVVVNDSPPLMAIPATGMVVIIILLVSLLITATFCLILLRYVSSSSDQKSDLKSDLKSKELSVQETASNKSQNGHMFASSDEEGDDENNTRVLSAAELDGFIDYMRSGIINMDYHSMSPVIQFNNINYKPPHLMNDPSKEREFERHTLMYQL